MIEITPAGPIEPEHIIAARNRSTEAGRVGGSKWLTVN
jgi:hypothetical protein